MSELLTALETLALTLLNLLLRAISVVSEKVHRRLFNDPLGMA